MEATLKTLKPTSLAAALELCVGAGRPPMVHGDPGIGKSQIAMQVADKMFAEKYGFKVEAGVLLGKSHGAKVWEAVPHNFQRPWFRDVRAALLDAVDLRGLPTVEGGKATWAVPDFLPTDERGGILFLDEINRGTEMVANACFSLVLDGRIGEYVMPKAWVAAAAVNDKDKGARKMSSALLARFTHLDAVTDLADVCKLAVERNWHPAVVAFLRFRPELLHIYTPTDRVSPNPRAWEFVSKLVSVGAQLPAEIEFPLIAGNVGDAAAIEFIGFLRLYRSLPNLDQIISDPMGAPVSNKPDVLYAVSSALARRATAKNFGNILKYLERLPEEYNVACVIDAARRNGDIASLPAYTKWQIAHSDVTGV